MKSRTCEGSSGGAHTGAGTLSGGSGDDAIDAGLGSDIIDGGAGYDTAIFSPGAGRIGGSAMIDLKAGTALEFKGSPLYGQDPYDRSQLISIEHVVLVNGGTATGSDGNDWLEERDVGNDAFTSYAVTFAGGAGDDTVYGGRGADTLSGGEGRDLIVGYGGADVIDGGLGRDSIYGGAGTDRFIYRSVADSTQGDGTDAIHDFESGIDKVDLSAAPGGEVLVERIEGHSFVSFSPVSLAGGGVRFDGIVLVDQVVQGSDLLTGSGVRVTLRGGSFNETLAGGAGGDVIEGGSGDSLLSGGGGDDRIRGGSGRDSIYGGAGADTFLFRAAGDSSPGARTDAIHDFQTGVDKIALPSEAGRYVVIEHNADGSSYVSFDEQFDPSGGVSFAGIVLVDNAIGAGDIDAPGALILERAAGGAAWTLPDQAPAHDPLYIG